VLNAYNAIGATHEAVIHVLPKIKALADDPTRTLPGLHDVGHHSAERTNEVLTNTKTTLLSEADKAKLAANEIIDESFRADPTRKGIQSEIRT
jgi:hypothetical protein